MIVRFQLLSLSLSPLFPNMHVRWLTRHLLTTTNTTTTTTRNATKLKPYIYMYTPHPRQTTTPLWWLMTFQYEIISLAQCHETSDSKHHFIPFHIRSPYLTLFPHLFYVVLFFAFLSRFTTIPFLLCCLVFMGNTRMNFLFFKEKEVFFTFFVACMKI